MVFRMRISSASPMVSCGKDVMKGDGEGEVQTMDRKASSITFSKKRAVAEAMVHSIATRELFKCGTSRSESCAWKLVWEVQSFLGFHDQYY